METSGRRAPADIRQKLGPDVCRMSAGCLPDHGAISVPFWSYVGSISVPLPINVPLNGRCVQTGRLFGVTFVPRDGTGVTFWRPGVVQELQKGAARRREDGRYTAETWTEVCRMSAVCLPDLGAISVPFWSHFCAPGRHRCDIFGARKWSGASKRRPLEGARE